MCARIPVPTPPRALPTRATPAQALSPDSAYITAARGHNWGRDEDDGVEANVDAFKRLLDEGVTPVVGGAQLVEPSEVLDEEGDE